MIFVKSAREIDAMRRAGELTGQALAAAGRVIEPGIATRQIEAAILSVFKRAGAQPAFLRYNGFPKAVCVSVNEEVIHGIPGARLLREGDIVSVDVGARWNGYIGDAACTFRVGRVSREAARLAAAARDCFYRALSQAREGKRVSDLSHAVQRYAEEAGYTVVRDFTGHGVGTDLHEEPEIPNFGRPGRGPRLLRGMTIAVEPMLNAGVPDVKLQKDGWTVVTLDGKLSAHFEHTVLVTGGEPELLTAWPEESMYYEGV